MGGSSSKAAKREEQHKNGKPISFADRVKAGVEEEIYKRTMMQREIQMALNVAKARDSIQIFGTVWMTLVGGVGVAKTMGRAVPGVVAVPIMIGAVALGNMADMAYGNKLQRVCREAE